MGSLALLSGVHTYGVCYLAQPRRQSAGEKSKKNIPGYTGISPGVLMWGGVFSKLSKGGVLSSLLTLIGTQSRFGDKLLIVEVLCPQHMGLRC